MSIELKIVRHDKMFPFVDSYKEVITGCDFNCSYCWAREKEKEFRQTTPEFNFRCLTVKPRPNTVVFLNSRSDSFCMGVRGEWLKAMWAYTRKYPDTTFLSMTKNPVGYQYWMTDIPKNVILGATIETNRDTLKYSRAPNTNERYAPMSDLDWPNKFLSIEPIMEFDFDIFHRWIQEIKPRWVAIGYDNYNNGLPEPYLADTEALIKWMEWKGITVFRKTIRERWVE